VQPLALLAGASQIDTDPRLECAEPIRPWACPPGFLPLLARLGAFIQSAWQAEIGKCRQENDPGFGSSSPQLFRTGPTGLLQNPLAEGCASLAFGGATQG
jgi:hypothetical protein